ncbi:MAG TPA: septum formation initiator family protein [Kofleriaceae bacterium]|nr:septum formation initiator family protein [Kofleriaceae bacterium]
MASSRLHGDPNWRRWGARLGIAALLALGAAAWPYQLLGGPASAQVERMSADVERTRDSARAQSANIAELRREIDALKNQPSAIEDIARRELGMVMPGEVVLRFEPGDPPPAAGGTP